MKRTLLFAATIFIASCGNKNEYDASGTFEAIETIISAEATGVIMDLNIHEGQQLRKGEAIGYIDTTQLYLRKKQLQAQAQAVLGKKPDVPAQLAALQVQLRQAEHEQRRTSRLMQAGAATQKQLDDANVLVSVLEKQIQAQQSSLQITSSTLGDETLALDAQIKQVNDQLLKSRIINTMNGTVLTKYAEAQEMAVAGKPLYKIADLHTITLRAYITGDQLATIRLNQQVQVLADATEKKYKVYPGTIAWISSKAEFTPKTIQTKDERANLVYAVRINVKNDGFLKIGMYGAIKF